MDQRDDSFVDASDENQSSRSNERSVGAPIAAQVFHIAQSLSLVNIIASTIEVSAISIVIISTTLRTWLDPSFAARPAGTPPDMLMTFILFLMLDPVATGGFVWARVDLVPCQKGSGSAQCRVGDDLLRAIGAFRVFGVYDLILINTIYYGMLHTLISF